MTLQTKIVKEGSWYVFASYFGSLLGPFYDSDDTSEPYDVIGPKIKSPKGVLIQGSRIGQENSVEHHKTNVSATINPGLVPAPGTIVNSHAPFGYDEMTIRTSAYQHWGIGNRPITPSFSSVHFNIVPNEDGATGHSRHGNVFRYASISRGEYWGDYYGTTQWSGFVVEYEIEFIPGDRSQVILYNSISSGWQTTQGRPSFEAAQAWVSEKLATGPGDTKKRNIVYKDYPKDRSSNMDQINKWLSNFKPKDISLLSPSLEFESWGDLTHNALGNLQSLSANMIAFVKDLKDIKTLIPKLRNLQNVKTHANNYLAYQYGIMPTISDIKAIFESFSTTKYYDRTGLRRVSAYARSASSVDLHGMTWTARGIRRLHVAVDERDTGYKALVEKAREIGFLPSLTNLWDLVPYSFVLDWFIDVGSVLERIDTHHQLLNLDIPYTIMSEKIELDYSESNLELGVTVDVRYTWYHRDVSTFVPQPRIFGEIGKPPTAQNHWVEGSALLLQRTK